MSRARVALYVCFMGFSYCQLVPPGLVTAGLGVSGRLPSGVTALCPPRRDSFQSTTAAATTTAAAPRPISTTTTARLRPESPDVGAGSPVTVAGELWNETVDCASSASISRTRASSVVPELSLAAAVSCAATDAAVTGVHSTRTVRGLVGDRFDWGGWPSDDQFLRRGAGCGLVRRLRRG